MKNQSGTIKTNLELDRVVMGGSGGYRRLPGGSAHFSLHTNRQTLHHNIYIINIIITVIIATVIIIFTMFLQLGSNFDPEFEVIYEMPVLLFTTTTIIMATVLLLLFF